MKVIRIFAALAITVLLFYIASSNSEGRPELRIHSENGYDFQFNTVPKILEFQSDSVVVNVEGHLDGMSIVLRHTESGATSDTPLDAYLSQTMTPDPSTPNKFRGDLTAGEKLKRVYYFFEVVDTSGVVVATFKESETPFWLRGIGDVPKLVLGSHILLIFATVFFVLMAAMQALQLIRGEGSMRAFGLHMVAATVLCFVGGYPIGFAMNWYAFGGIWEGVPFGTDATDNKTQILFLYLVFMMLATLKSATGCQCACARDFFSRKATGWFGLGALALMILIYFIPHSAQYDPTLTKVVCYGWAALMALLSVIGFVRSKGAETN